MDCARARKLFSLHLDGILPPSEEAFLWAHLGSCAGCRRELAGLKSALELLRGLPELAPAEGFADRVKLRLAGEAARGGGVPKEAARRAIRFFKMSKKPGFWLAVTGMKTWPRLAAAAALFLVFGIAYLWSGLWSGQGEVKKGAGTPKEVAAVPFGEKGAEAEKILVFRDGPEAPAGREAKRSGDDLAGGRADGPPGKERGAADALIQGAPDAPGSAPFASPAPAGGEKKSSPGDPGAAAKTAPQRAAGEALFTVRAAPEAGEAAALSSVPAGKVAREVRLFVEGVDGGRLEPLLNEYAGRDQKVEPPFSLRIPPAQLPVFLAALRSLGADVREEKSVRDFTEEYSRLEAALVQKQEEVKKLLAAGDQGREGGASSAGLQRLEEEIAGLKKKMRDIDEQTNLVSVKVFWPR